MSNKEKFTENLQAAIGNTVSESWKYMVFDAYQMNLYYDEQLDGRTQGLVIAISSLKGNLPKLENGKKFKYKPLHVMVSNVWEKDGKIETWYADEKEVRAKMDKINEYNNAVHVMWRDALEKENTRKKNMRANLR